MSKYIDDDAVDITDPSFGTDDFIYDCIAKCSEELRIDHDDELKELCQRMVQGFVNIVATAPVADIYTAEQFREDIKLLEKMCEHTVCSDCRFNSRSCDTSGIDLNELRAWAEAERAKIKELHSGKLCGKNADIMIIDDPIAKGGAE